MRLNKQELVALASQPDHKFEKQGVLFLKERTEGFFRRNENEKTGSLLRNKSTRRDSFSCVAPNGQVESERWFRLCGNLLFYLKTQDHWSEPVGVIILENHCITVDTKPDTGGDFSAPCFRFQITFHGGSGSYNLAALSEAERNSWVTALSNASFSNIKNKVDRLKNELSIKLAQKSAQGMGMLNSKLVNPPAQQQKAAGYVKDVSETPLCEISLSCDNLLCDSHGRAPTAKILVHTRTCPAGQWFKYACTEMAERNSNPVFLATITFRTSDGVSESSEARFTVYDVRERITSTAVVIGQLTCVIGSLKAIDRVRLPIRSPENSTKHVGFLTIVAWNLKREERSSTESTPCRLNPYENVPNQHPASSSLTFSHRRTQSLPPRLQCKFKVPLQSNFGMLFSHPFMQSYRFHSGLGGDIYVHEMMAEAKLSHIFPQQLLSVWIAEEKELLQEMVGLGQLREPWHASRAEIIQRHLWLINIYTQARVSLATHKGSYNFKPSSTKADPTFEFVPLNLHLQRMWVQNESLHKSGFHDTITVGAFTAYAQGYESGGLVKMLQRFKTELLTSHEKGRKGNHSSPNYTSNKVTLTYESVQGIKRLRREIVERMQIIMKLAKERKTYGLHKYVDEIYQRCQLLLSVCDHSLIEEAFYFLEHNKLMLPTSQAYEYDGVESDESQELNRSSTNIDEGIETPNSPYRFVVDVTDPGSSTELSSKQSESEDKTPDSGLGIEEIVKSFLDSPSSNYYRPSEEPEPWDLTQLNIEASMISLNSKVLMLCGMGVDIQHRHLPRPGEHQQQQHYQRKRPSTSTSSTLDSRSATDLAYHSLELHELGPHHSLPKAPQISHARAASMPVEGYTPTPHLHLMCPPESAGAFNWSDELRSSVKKLRLATDGLLKTCRLAHSIFRLQEPTEKSKLALALKYRRDVCFSHALTSLVAGLMGRLWCRKPDPTFLYVLTKLGPLVSFHSFLTYYSHEAEMFNDMIVAVEDLRTVEFVMVIGGGDEGCPPLPKVHGSRSALKVILPVPEAVFSMLALDKNWSSSFVVTPVFFNIGINEQATLAERLGSLMEPQERSNLDNFARLNEYYRRFCKQMFPAKYSSKRGQDDCQNLDKLFDRMHAELLSKKRKNVAIIHLSSQICRALMGLRYTSCKSGKDRTSMSVTLEQIQILSEDYDLAEHEFQSALDAMRSEGCRRENTLKNIGQRKYAFNHLQVLSLPKKYRPPAGTFGNVQT